MPNPTDPRTPCGKNAPEGALDATVEKDDEIMPPGGPAFPYANIS